MGFRFGQREQCHARPFLRGAGLGCTRPATATGTGSRLLRAALRLLVDQLGPLAVLLALAVLGASPGAALATPG
ncbi:hypothetical protein, partial [Streptomyces sp. NPDC056723]|uniref:hypothetical protein n=1 Tax=Streptomyces sp. NPDC056723 TaxID=3345925 RepID=UPI003675CB37